MTKEIEKREAAIHLLRIGHNVEEVAQEVERHPNWVRKWYKRYQAEGWSGLEDRSRSPKKHGKKIKDKVWQDICQARSELEAEAERAGGLKYVGPIAVRTKLKDKKVKPLPSTSTIERVLQEHKMTRPYQKGAGEKRLLCQGFNYSNRSFRKSFYLHDVLMFICLLMFFFFTRCIDG